MTNDREQYRSLGAKNGDEDEALTKAYAEMSPEQRRLKGLWDDERASRQVERLTEVNEDWMVYTIRLLRNIERLREENRSLMQTIRRVLRAEPVGER